MTDLQPDMPDARGHWKRTLYASVAGQFLVNAGIGFVFPFLPFFVKELGVETEQGVRQWTGLIFAANGITMCLSAPVWGALGDRFGRKLMVLRSMLALSVLMPLMAGATHPWHLVALRLCQGVFSGTITANMAMVAGVAPLKRTGYAMGLIYVAADAGRVLGPSVGGVMADLVGYRPTFVAAGAFPLAGASLIGFFARDVSPDASAKHGGKPGVSMASLAMTAGVAALLVSLFLNSVSQSMAGPLVPLFVAGFMSNAAGASSITGWIISAQALVKIVVTGPLSRTGDRLGHGRVLCFGVAVGSASLLLHAFATNVVHLGVLRALVGVSTAAIMPSASALLRKLGPPHAIGKVLGMSQSVRSLGHMAGPLAGGLISAQIGGMWGLRLPFVFAGVLTGAGVFLFGRKILRS